MKRGSQLPVVVVAGQTPPPTGGQNIMIERILKELEQDPRWRTAHWNFRFTPTFSTVRKAQLSKLLELCRVIGRAIALRLKFGRVDLLLYPSGGPQTVPVIRDILLLPVAKWLSRSVWVQFHAAGIADRLSAKTGLVEKLLSWAYRAVDGAIVMANFNRCDPEALGISKIEIIPHLIKDENPEGQSNSHPPPATRDSLLTILYAGHLYDQKGTPQLVDAFAEVVKEFPETRLILMGEFLPPWSEAAFREQCERLNIADKVEWLGVLRGESKAEQFRKASLFVFPTIAPYESFGLVMAEAMMWGLPIVATDWRGNRDVAGPDAWYCPVPSPVLPELATTILQALRESSRFAEVGTRNRERFLEKFSFDSRAGNYRRWGEGLVAGNE